MTISRQIRTVRAAAAAAAAALAVSLGTLQAADRGPAGKGPAPAVSVVGRDGAYRIDGSFSVDAPAAVVWDVLTDYDRLPSFVSSMRSSTSTRDASGRLLVTQEAVGRAGPFSRTLHVVLEVEEEAPDRIAFRDVCGGSFHSYAGVWTIDADGAGVLVSYELRARPLSSPPLLGRSILASNARGLLGEVRLEILRRGLAAGAE
ncbi:MAG TPA: SRPBCC family protein [Vicinamibacteria bacterium]|nr:SRPBCC family protein [Vicinamibacteria bacterium]